MTVRRPFAWLACTVLASASLVATGAQASAADEYAGAADRHAGSQIALHEGVHGQPRPAARMAGEQVLGHDVSGWQGDVDWPSAREGGARFVYVKATEGTGYRNEHFTQQYNGSYEVGMLRGAYHFARPDVSGGGEQAEYFVAGGGGWSPDGRTLPGALDMEYNPHGDACYGKSPAQLVAWIKAFSDTYTRSTGTAPVIYTSTSWWQRCTGGSAAFGDTNPLWLARYAPEIGPLPPGWGTHTIWQFSDSGRLPGDQNYFNGAVEQLATLATG
ncbi:GH25 family lysozyme M1 (1,4-beta-N-acetylmuramidase) [Saccharomonospora amisosensis]|uniref:Lysozyme n=1 Tax=Saccharomonospora amisosensis TaxID=1128677 RepID=A0A7X5UVD5_9PSEU|nr:lysozyme [Saccharomonospora amisosensis]NIJ14865.1 GH25 family lysozyme M1 (1,4-beta-N-acetylmuramidase) [Saccharomonospora amisosensis]